MSSDQETDGIVYIDIDIAYSFFVYSTHYAVLKRKIKELRGRYGPLKAYIRSSSSGNVHVKLIFGGTITVLDGFLIRAFLKDDVYRLSLDMARYYHTSDLDEINRCFDVKIDTEIKYAGEWEDIDFWKNDTDKSV